MTIQKRLARSNIAMLAIPLITAAVLAALAACGTTWRCCMTRLSRRKSRKSRS